MTRSRTSITTGIMTKKPKLHQKKQKDYCFILQPKANHQRSKILFRDFCWIGPYPVEKVLPNNNYILRKLNTNKTQILHRIRTRKNNPEKPLEDNYQEAQWQVDDNIVILQDSLYTHAWEAEFGGQLFDICIFFTDLYTIDFQESYTQGLDTVVVPSSYLHDSSDSQNREAYPTFHPSVEHPSNPKSYGQSQDLETATDPSHNDSSTPTLESSTDNETAYEPMQQPPSGQSDNPSTLEINDPLTERIPQ